MEYDLPNPSQPETTLREKAEAAAGTARETVTNTLSKGEQYYREQPWAVVGGAFVLGIALGVALYRRQPEPTALESAAQRLEQVIANLSDQIPSKKKIQSFAQDLPIAPFFASLGKKLHAW